MFFVEIFLTALALALTLPFVRWKWYWRGLAALGMLCCAFKFHIFYLLSGNYFSPSIPLWLQVGSGWAFAGFFIMMGFCVFNVAGWTLFWLCRRFLFRQPGGFPRRLCAFGNLACALLAAVISAAGCVNGMSLPEVRVRTLFFPNLPAAAEGFRIVVISDLHTTYTTDTGRAAEIVRLANGCGGDVIVCTGDNYDGPTADLTPKLEALRDLRAPLGVLGVTGNHEYYVGKEEMAKWMEFYADCGIEMLENRRIDFPEREISIGGISDELGRFKVASIFVGAPEGYFRVFLAHRPINAARAAAAGADLQISGHTHGGMLPGLALLVRLFNDGMDSGIFQKYGITVAVCNGAGIWSGFPLRICCPTEIMVLELHRGGTR